MKTTLLYLKGMHCNACKLLVEKALITLPTIQAVDAKVSKGQVRLKYTENLNLEEIATVMRETGYELLATPPVRPRLSKDLNDYKILVISLLAFIFLYFLLKQVGITTLFDIQADTPSSGLVLLIGITAGFSSCMAVIGGLVLAISSKWNVHNAEKSFGKKLIPHFRFNAWRLIGFGMLGGVLGMFGSVLSLSPMVMAVMTLIVGGVMLLLGFNLTNISPRLNGLSLALPTWKWFAAEETDVLQGATRGIQKYFGAFISGALTFFVPCGFTFAMQLYAMQTGSFWMGAVVMLLFAGGTLPWLLGIGSLTSVFKGKIAQVAYKVIGVLVILLGLYNIANSYGVVGANLRGNSDVWTNWAVQAEKIQMTYTTKGLLPTILELEAGKNYEIFIDVQTSVYGCMSTIFISWLDHNIQSLKKWAQLVFHIQPTKVGTYEFLCAMGVPHGASIVVK